MSKDATPARVVFRRRSGEGEAALLEEREVECAPEDLAALLASPWDDRAGTGEPGVDASDRTDPATLFDALVARLRFTVTERPASGGGRAFELAFAPERGDAPVEPMDSRESPEGTRIVLQGAVNGQVGSDDKGPHVELAHDGTARQSIRVHNTGVQVNHWGNCYLNLHLSLRCVIDCRAPPTVLPPDDD